MGDLGGVCGDLEPLCGARYMMVLGCVSRPSRRRVLDLDSVRNVYRYVDFIVFNVFKMFLKCL